VAFRFSEDSGDLSVVLAYGYRYGEVELPDIPPWKPSFKLLRYSEADRTVRPAVSETLGCHFVGAALPTPCHNDALSALAGVLKRFATLTPVPVPSWWNDCLKFADWYVPTQFKPIASDADTSVEAWLCKCKNYTQKRKASLLDAYYGIKNRLDPRNIKVKSFIKDEPYTEYKFPRPINSRSDEFKTLCGPYFRLIEEIFFKHPDFIKKVPVAQRPEYLFRKLSSLGDPVQCMDFKAMESHFTKLTFELEFRFYEFMTQFLPHGDRFMNEIRLVLAGKNHCSFKLFDIEVEASRMSGEMNTSLGNGFVNWILSKYLAYRNGCLESHRGIYEGDDSAVVSPYVPTPTDYQNLGFKVEMSVEPTLSTASFCGLIFDDSDLRNITNPLVELISFGWTNMRYVGARRGTKLALLKCKSLSMMYQYAGCPILSSLGKMGYRISKHADIRRVADGLSLWEKEQLADVISDSRKVQEVSSIPVGIRTRLLMEKMYGIRVEDQILVENYLDKMTKLEPIRIPQLHKYLHKDWIDYWQNYVVEYAEFDPVYYRRPPKVWVKRFRDDEFDPFTMLSVR